MRLFVAVPIAEDVREQLTQLQARLIPLAVQTGVRVKWVEPENFHLTVSFLGDLSEASVPDIEDACTAIAADTLPFRIRIAGVSVFPKPHSSRATEVRTIWVGLSEGSEPWRAMIERAEPWFVPFGAPREGGLVPHITLGRVKTERTAAAGNSGALRTILQAESSADGGGMQADCLALIESTLDPRGATYREVRRWQFGQT